MNALDFLLLQVWNSRSGICLHTLGPESDDGIPGHTKKISAMTVNELQPCKHFHAMLYIVEMKFSVLSLSEVVCRDPEACSFKFCKWSFSFLNEPLVAFLGLAATSGGDGDNKLLLWNVLTGELASDLNAAYRLVNLMDLFKCALLAAPVLVARVPDGEMSLGQFFHAVSVLSSLLFND